MSYFAHRSDSVRLPLGNDATQGLRLAQRGAIGAVMAHFSISQQPSIIVMPTGSGKTAVLMTIPFLLSANRVLVITPSRLVRDQIANDFETLRTLRTIGVIPQAETCPKILKVEHRISNDKWDELLEYDVVIGTPNVLSPAAPGVDAPPKHLFDLVLIDEAHHAPASTWTAILQHFADSRQVLFTATPFRNDKREIPGKFSFIYPLANAYRDRVFGSIHYEAVRPADGQSADEAIARAAAKQLAEDRASGLKHSLLIRTDRRARADELKDLYANSTNLRVQVIHSNHSSKHVSDAIKRLKSQELDAIISVNMLGEGFDFPNLKIAAVHSPCKSLANTLQLIGRFARTNAEDVGDARFFAVPSEIEIEAQRLYEEGAVWQEMVTSLWSGRTENEVKTKEVLDGFAHAEYVEELLDFPLSAMSVKFYAKIYQVSQCDLEAQVECRSLSILHRWVNLNDSCLVVIGGEAHRPGWTSSDLLSEHTYSYVIAYHDQANKLLFINSSVKSDRLFADFAESLTGNTAVGLPTSMLDKVFAGLNSTEFYNIGVRNRSASRRESYRIVTGAGVQQALTASYSRSYHKGHIYGAGKNSSGNREVLGYSSMSKVWSSEAGKIPDYIVWCKMLAARLSGHSCSITNSALDLIPTAEPLSAIPDDIISGSLPDESYFESANIEIRNDGELLFEGSIHDVELIIDGGRVTANQLAFYVSVDGLRVHTTSSLTDPSKYVVSSPFETSVIVMEDEREVKYDIAEYFSSRQPRFYCADGSLIRGRTIERRFSSPEPYEQSLIEAVDWAAHGVTITTEFGASTSIHDYVETRLVNEDWDYVFYDHGSGEMADYIAIKDTPESLEVRLFHCKAATGEVAGDRLEDVYEVCGQVVKSTIWFQAFERLGERIKHRNSLGVPHSPGKQRFIKGTCAGLEQLLRDRALKSRKLNMVVVQPGVSKANISEKLSTVLNAANDAIAGDGFEKMCIICSG